MVDYLRNRMANQIDDSDGKFTKAETVLLPKRSKNVSIIDNGYIKNGESCSDTHPKNRDHIERIPPNTKTSYMPKLTNWSTT